MQDRIDPRDEADLTWYFNDAEGDLKRIRSLQSSFEASMERRARMKAHPHYRFSCRNERGELVTHATVDVGLRCGPVYVGEGDEQPEPSTSLDGRALAAAARERRIRIALNTAGPDAAHALRLRFREVLPVCRMPFGAAGVGPARAGAPLRTSVARTALRGAGALAHLTPTALELYPVETPKRVDGLGRRLLAAPLPWERERGAQLRREAERLVLERYDAYRRALLGFPARGLAIDRAA